MRLLGRALTRLRRFKPAWVLYNVVHWRRLRANAERYRELGLRKSVVGTISHKEVSGATDEVPWLDRPDAAKALAQADLAPFPEPVRSQIGRWVDDGFIVLERYFSEALIDEINTDIERLLEEGSVDHHYRGKRIPDAFKASEPIARATRDPQLVRLLSFLLGREVALFQTINFFEGSQQSAHSDSFHMTTEPKGYLIAIWVALEDVVSESGPVFYYPGSHRLPYVMSEDFASDESSLFLARDKDERYERKIAEVVAEAGIEPVDFLARKGDVLVWHANLLHGGRPIGRSGLTRRSLVAHYFAKGVLCYHEVTERPALVEG